MIDTASALRIRTTGLWLAIASALVAGAVLAMQYGYGYAPCKLCLTERLPYYAAVPLGLVALLVPMPLAGRLALGLASLGLLYGAGLGAYHAGAEWGFWAGPTECGGGTGANPAEIGDFRSALQATKVVDCSVAALRVLGISLAGWNAVAALGLAVLAGNAAIRR